MIQVSKDEFMRAVCYHKLNVNYRCAWADEKVHGIWTISHEIVCEQTEILSRIKIVNVTKVFKEKYIDTTPDPVWHCRTCLKLPNCEIARDNKYEFCTGWLA